MLKMEKKYRQSKLTPESFMKKPVVNVAHVTGGTMKALPINSNDFKGPHVIKSYSQDKDKIKSSQLWELTESDKRRGQRYFDEFSHLIKLEEANNELPRSPLCNHKTNVNNLNLSDKIKKVKNREFSDFDNNDFDYSSSNERSLLKRKSSENVEATNSKEKLNNMKEILFKVSRENPTDASIRFRVLVESSPEKVARNTRNIGCQAALSKKRFQVQSESILSSSDEEDSEDWSFQTRKKAKRGSSSSLPSKMSLLKGYNLPMDMDYDTDFIQPMNSCSANLLMRQCSKSPFESRNNPSKENKYRFFPKMNDCLGSERNQINFDSFDECSPSLLSKKETSPNIEHSMIIGSTKHRKKYEEGGNKKDKDFIENSILSSKVDNCKTVEQKDDQENIKKKRKSLEEVALNHESIYKMPKKHKLEQINFEKTVDIVPSRRKDLSFNSKNNSPEKLELTLSLRKIPTCDIIINCKKNSDGLKDVGASNLGSNEKYSANKQSREFNLPNAISSSNSKSSSVGSNENLKMTCLPNVKDIRKCSHSIFDSSDDCSQSLLSKKETTSNTKHSMIIGSKKFKKKNKEGSNKKIKKDIDENGILCSNVAEYKTMEHKNDKRTTHKERISVEEVPLLHELVKFIPKTPTKQKFKKINMENDIKVNEKNNKDVHPKNISNSNIAISQTMKHGDNKEKTHKKRKSAVEVPMDQDNFKSTSRTPKKQKLKKKINMENTFNLFPSKEKDLDFVYKNEVVRKKAERNKMPGWSCHECRDYYLTRILTPEQLKKAMDNCSRHRARHRPVTNTPENFWDCDLSDSSYSDV